MKLTLINKAAIVLFLLFGFKPSHIIAQDVTNPEPELYRGSAEKINDLLHTKLNVKFDYAKKFLYGEAWITLKPHLYSTDSLTLDAKGMDIKQVSLITDSKELPLKFKYDSLKLKISLDKKYNSSQTYTIYIDYTSKPNQLKVKGSAAITDAKG